MRKQRLRGLKAALSFLLAASVLLSANSIVFAQNTTGGTLPTVVTDKVNFDDFRGHEVYASLQSIIDITYDYMGFSIHDGMGEIISITDCGYGYDDYLVDIRLTVSGGIAVGYLMCSSPAIYDGEWFIFTGADALSFIEGTYSLAGLQKWTVADFMDMNAFNFSFLTHGVSSDDVQVEVQLIIYPDPEPYVLPKEDDWNDWMLKSSAVFASYIDEIMEENGDSVINLNSPACFNVPENADYVCGACISRETKYDTLADAIAAAKDDDIIIMLADDASGMTTVDKKLIIIDNGFDVFLTADDDYAIKKTTDGYLITNNMSRMLGITADNSINGAILSDSEEGYYILTSKSGVLDRSTGAGTQDDGYWIGVNFEAGENSLLKIDGVVHTDDYFYVNLGDNAGRTYTISYDADGSGGTYMPFYYTIKFEPDEGAIASMDADTSGTLTGEYTWEDSNWCELMQTSVDGAFEPSSFFSATGYTYTGTPSRYTNRKIREGQYGTGSLINEWDGDTLVASYIIIVRGDVDGDSVCDAKDCMLADFHMNDYSRLSGYNFIAADVQRDDVIDIFDYSVILNRSVGLSSEV